MRLDKALTFMGLTRSQARRAVADGRVRVNGLTVRDAGMAVSPGDVSLDGAEIAAACELTLMLNKPAGLITATRDRLVPTVMDLVPENLANRSLGPVGRLDKDVTGLVLLTTDGQLAHRLISPRRHVEKVYLAHVEGDMDENALAAIRAGGLEFSDFVSKPAGAEIVGPGAVRLTLTEGKFHEVKRICARVGHPVLRLKRLSIAGVELDPALGEGMLRELTPSEARRLYAAAGMEMPQSAPDDPKRR